VNDFDGAASVVVQIGTSRIIATIRCYNFKMGCIIFDGHIKNFHGGISFCFVFLIRQLYHIYIDLSTKIFYFLSYFFEKQSKKSKLKNELKNQNLKLSFIKLWIDVNF